MKRFNYVCKVDDRIIADVLLASSVSKAAIMLEQKGYTIIRLEEEEDFNLNPSSSSKDSFSIKEKKEFFSSLYHQYKSGLPIVEIFSSIAIGSKNQNVRNLALNISSSLKRGEEFNEIILRYSNTIGRENALLLIAGNESGKLFETSYGILKNVEKEEKIVNNLISKSIYPLIVLGLAVFAFLVMNLFVFPQIQSAVKGVGGSENVIFVLVKKLILIFIIMGFGAFCLKNLYHSKGFRKDFKRFIFNFAPVKKAYKLFNYVIFFRLLSVSYKAGYPLIKSVELVSDVIKKFDFERKIDKVQKMLEEGTEVASAFRISGLFSDFAISQITTAQQTGEYDEAFRLIALDYEDELNIQIKVLLNAFQVATLLICGVVVLICGIGFFTTYYKALFSLF